MKAGLISILFSLGIAAVCCVSGARADDVTAPGARILVVGDSNATGAGQRSQQAWTMRLSRSTGRMVQVFGAPGASLATPFSDIGDVPECIVRNELGYGLHVAILALGTNDAATPHDAIRDAVDATITATRAPWLCLLPPPVRNATQEAALVQVRQIIQDECTAHGAAILDGTQVLTLANLDASGVHFTKLGHMKMARAVRCAIEQMHLPPP